VSHRSQKNNYFKCPPSYTKITDEIEMYNQARSYRGAFGAMPPQILFAPPNFVVPRKIYFKHKIKTNILPP